MLAAHDDANWIRQAECGHFMAVPATHALSTDSEWPLIVLAAIRIDKLNPVVHWSDKGIHRNDDWPVRCAYSSSGKILVVKTFCAGKAGGTPDIGGRQMSLEAPIP